MSQLVEASPSDAGSLDELTQRRTYLATAKLRLYKSSLLPNAQTTAADFIAAEADFTGYAAVVLSWSPVSVGSDLSWAAESIRAFYQATDAVAPNVIGGAWLETTAGVLQEFFPFPVPANMGTALAFIGAVVTIKNPAVDVLVYDN